MGAGPNNGSETRAYASSLSTKAIGQSLVRVRAGDGAFLHGDLRCDVLDIAMTARMWNAVESRRRWAAAGIFRLSNFIFALNLHHQRRISHHGLRTVLSGTRWLERFGGQLALCTDENANEQSRTYRVNGSIDQAAISLGRAALMGASIAGSAHPLHAAPATAFSLEPIVSAASWSVGPILE
jgi:hypothetical protein